MAREVRALPNRDASERAAPAIQFVIRNSQSAVLQLSGLEPLKITPEFGFAVIGERTNITGSPKFSKMILSENFEGALAIARQQVQGGANLLDVNMDEGMIDSEAAMTRFLNLLGSEPDITQKECGERAHSFRLSLPRPRGSWVAAMMMPPWPQCRAINCATEV